MQPYPILRTKLYVPPIRPELVSRPRLIERLNAGLSASRKLTLVSAPAGFGKTTLVSEWAAGCGRRTAWLSLDEGDSDLTRFLTYFITALQTLALRTCQQSRRDSVHYRGRGVGCAPVPSATANRIDSDGPAQ